MALCLILLFLSCVVGAFLLGVPFGSEQPKAKPARQPRDDRKAAPPAPAPLLAPQQENPPEEWLMDKGERYLRIMREHNVPDIHFIAFVEFVETGDVTGEDLSFCQLFEISPACQKAVDQAFAFRVAELQDAIRLLNGK